MINRREFLGTTIAVAIAANARAEGRASTHPDTVIELRQYTLRGGKRDTLIALFEEDFQQPLNDAGAHVIGTFRDLDDPDRFAWLRGFRDMDSRAHALATFYDGALWKSKRGAANATIVDSDNVLLLKPASMNDGFHAAPAHAGEGGIIGATSYYLGGVDAQAFAAFFDRSVRPRIEELGATPIARLVTEEAPNNFPRLPVREHERAFVWFARWPNVDAERVFATRFAALSGWRDEAPESILPALMRKPERLRLAPCAKSELR